MRRYYLQDDQWDCNKHLLHGSEGWVGVTARDNRQFVEAVLYRYRAGTPEPAPAEASVHAKVAAHRVVASRYDAFTSASGSPVRNRPQRCMSARRGPSMSDRW